ncbi:MAG: response regulator [Thermodesulfobacteriota bacterium]
MRPGILIVEDEIVVAMEIEEKLRSQGYDVTSLCSSGEEAAVLVNRRCPDLVLMDIKLDGNIDGIEAAELIRRDHDIPIVYLTAYADEATLERAKRTEPFGYLVKPFSGAELRTTIEVALYKHQQEIKTREAARWLESVTNVLGSALIVTDLDGVVRHMNHVAETLTGWTQEQAVGAQLSEVYVLKDPQTGKIVDSPAASPLRLGLASGTSHFILLSKQDTDIRIEQTLLPRNDSHGIFSGIIVAFHETVGQAEHADAWFNHAANLYLTAALSDSDGDYSRAESYYKRTLLLFERHLGSDDPKALNVMNDLAGLYRKTGRQELAAELERRTVADAVQDLRTRLREAPVWDD